MRKMGYACMNAFQSLTNRLFRLTTSSASTTESDKISGNGIFLIDLQCNARTCCKTKTDNFMPHTLQCKIHGMVLMINGGGLGKNFETQ